MRLAGGADHHDVVGAVMGRHPHPPNIVFKPSRGDLGRDRLDRFGVDVSKVLGGGQRDAFIQGLGYVLITVTAGFIPFRLFPPDPTAASGNVVFEVFEDLPNVEFSILARHDCTPKLSLTFSQPVSFKSISPADLMSVFSSRERR